MSVTCAPQGNPAQTRLAQSCCSAPALFHRNRARTVISLSDHLNVLKINDPTAISVNVIEKKVFIWALALNGHSGEGLNLPLLCFYAVS